MNVTKSFLLFAAALFACLTIRAGDAPDFIKKLQDAKQFEYRIGGADPMLAAGAAAEEKQDVPIVSKDPTKDPIEEAPEELPKEKTEEPPPPEPEPEPAPEPQKAEAPEIPETPKTYDNPFDEFASLGIRVNGIFQTPGEPAAIVNGKFRQNGEVLLEERPQGDLFIESIESRAVLFRFKDATVRVEAAK